MGQWCYAAQYLDRFGCWVRGFLCGPNISPTKQRDIRTKPCSQRVHVPTADRDRPDFLLVATIAVFQYMFPVAAMLVFAVAYGKVGDSLVFSGADRARWSSLALFHVCLAGRPIWTMGNMRVEAFSAVLAVCFLSAALLPSSVCSFSFPPFFFLLFLWGVVPVGRRTLPCRSYEARMPLMRTF